MIVFISRSYLLMDTRRRPSRLLYAWLCNPFIPKCMHKSVFTCLIKYNRCKIVIVLNRSRSIRAWLHTIRKHYLFLNQFIFYIFLPSIQMKFTKYLGDNLLDYFILYSHEYFPYSTLIKN